MKRFNAGNRAHLLSPPSTSLETYPNSERRMKMNSNPRHHLQSTFQGPIQSLLGAVLAICALLCLPAAHAQLYTGSIAGTVKDPSGAILSGAQIKATDAEKGFEFSATSDSSGDTSFESCLLRITSCRQARLDLKLSARTTSE